MSKINRGSRWMWLAIGVLVIGGLLSGSFAYQLRFHERAVVTVFGEAGENSVISEPGLKFKLPYPIGQVTKYDTRSRIKSVRLETQQTKDSRPLVLEAYIIWSVSDPLKFFKNFSDAGERSEEHYAKAEDTLDGYLRSAVAEVSNFTMEELFSPKPGASRLSVFEERMLASVRTGAGRESGALSELGIEAKLVGVSRVQLVAAATSAVFERMREERAAVAKQIEAKGRAEKNRIESEARSSAEQIRAFARSLAEEYRRRGDAEAAEFIAAMNEHPELAIFLRNVEMMRSVIPLRATFVLPTSTFGMGLASPDATRRAGNGVIPGLQALDQTVPASAATTPTSAPPTTANSGGEP